MQVGEDFVFHKMVVSSIVPEETTSLSLIPDESEDIFSEFYESEVLDNIEESQSSEENSNSENVLLSPTDYTDESNNSPLDSSVSLVVSEYLPVISQQLEVGNCLLIIVLVLLIIKILSSIMAALFKS